MPIKFGLSVFESASDHVLEHWCAQCDQRLVQSQDKSTGTFYLVFGHQWTKDPVNDVGDFHSVMIALCPDCDIPEEKYQFRGYPCSIVPDNELWYVGGAHGNGGGILEWCTCEDDAYSRKQLMARDPSFRNLVARKYKD